MDRQKKFDILAEGQEYGVSKICSKYGISRTLFYRWLTRYKSLGIYGLDPIKKDFVPANRTLPHVVDSVLMLIKSYPAYGPREIKYLLEEIGHDISESAVYNIMKRHDLSTKDKRVKFAKRKFNPTTINLPPFDTMKSGECWIFWITPYGDFGSSGPIFEYTIFDYKSRIACSRLYDTLSLECFEDLLMAAAIPVAQSLDFSTSYLCFFEDYNLPQKNKKGFLDGIKNILQSSGFDITLYFLTEEEQRSEILSLKKEYTHQILSFMLPIIHSECSIIEIKLILQRHIRNYNIHDKSHYGELELSPIEYHSHVTGSKRILPLWAYIDRLY